MEPNELQVQLFNYLKSKLPPHLSLVDEVADLLHLSADSVYRRIRGEKPVTLIELKNICEHYKLSVDQLLQLKTEAVLFDAPALNNNSSEFSDYLKGMLQQFKYFNSFKKREIQYLCKDSTIWNFYHFPELAAFKTFFWSKTINNQQQLVGKLFSLDEYPYNDCFNLGQQVIQEYNLIPCVELWNLESMQSTINQIAFYKEAGHFKSENDFRIVVGSFHKLIDHLQLQAEKGVKFMPGDSDLSFKAPIQFYVNELILGNNNMVLTLEEKRVTMITYSVFQYLFTTDIRFTDKVISTFETLLSRSTLISKTGEKDRNRFFNALRKKINDILS